MMEDETSLELQNYLKSACETERELNVAEMYFNGGMTQRDISIVIGVSQPHVHRTIKKVIGRIQQSFKYLDYQTA
jgi:RNA polymerase sigma factor (sigma-70 family)